MERQEGGRGLSHHRRPFYEKKNKKNEIQVQNIDTIYTERGSVRDETLPRGAAGQRVLTGFEV